MRLTCILLLSTLKLMFTQETFVKFQHVYSIFNTDKIWIHYCWNLNRHTNCIFIIRHRNIDMMEFRFNNTNKHHGRNTGVRSNCLYAYFHKCNRISRERWPVQNTNNTVKISPFIYYYDFQLWSNFYKATPYRSPATSDIKIK